ncbi:MAG TPA: response regulator [Chitinophagaceae bacterium]|jgi:CheY-like chemotaxis protein|nr:response regulator [Chitinophagaceae bacterium]
MQSKLDWVLLVDDDNDCNFFHQRVLTTVGCTNLIDVANDGWEALDVLKAKALATSPGNGIIFLDINMPGLNGWEFLDEYIKPAMKLEQQIVIIMLSSSLNPDDKERALSYKCVNGFTNKPLTKVAVNALLAEHFPQKFNEPLVAAY